MVIQAAREDQFETACGIGFPLLDKAVLRPGLDAFLHPVGAVEEIAEVPERAVSLFEFPGVIESAGLGVGRAVFEVFF